MAKKEKFPKEIVVRWEQEQNGKRGDGYLLHVGEPSALLGVDAQHLERVAVYRRVGIRTFRKDARLD
jgi:hypothetical protein